MKVRPPHLAALGTTLRTITTAGPRRNANFFLGDDKVANYDPRVGRFGLVETFCTKPLIGCVAGSRQIRRVKFLETDGVVKAERGSFQSFRAIAWH
jgi:hypothetical protein